MILNLWNLEAAGIWSDSIPIPHQTSILQNLRTSIPIPIPIPAKLKTSIPIPIPIPLKTSIPQYLVLVLSMSGPNSENFMPANFDEGGVKTEHIREFQMLIT